VAVTNTVVTYLKTRQRVDEDVREALLDARETPRPALPEGSEPAEG
jgi:hypothetical protein